MVEVINLRVPKELAVALETIAANIDMSVDMLAAHVLSEYVKPLANEQPKEASVNGEDTAA